tara:strand:- start:369 stop:602 length:234 start_codon:yes stop_codon:yes gene_type:complete
MKTLILASLFCAQLASADTFIDQVDGEGALLCSDDSGEWVCKPVSREVIRELGWEDVEGIVPLMPPEEETEEKVPGC